MGARGLRTVERVVHRMRDEGLTWAQIGCRMGLSGDRVRVLGAQGQDKVRRAFLRARRPQRVEA